MRVWFSVGVLTLLLAVGGLFIGPHFIDWNKYKPDIVDAARDRFGFTIEIGGNVDFDLLPAPRVTLNRLTIQNEGEVPSAKARWARVTFGLHGFLLGSPKITRLEVVEPILNDALDLLTKLARDGGRGRLDDATAMLERTTIPLPSGLADTLGGQLFLPALALRYDEARHDWTFDGMAEGLAIGEAKLSGSVRARSQGDVQTTVTVARHDGLTLNFDAVAKPDSATINGRIEIKAPKLGERRIDLSASAPMVMDAASRTLILDPLSLSFAGHSVEGQASIVLANRPRLDIDLTASLLTISEDSGSRAEILAAAKWLSETARSVDLGLSVGAERLRWRKGILGRTRLTLTGDQHGIAVTNFTTRLPGDLGLTLSGGIQNADTEGGFTGPISVRGANLREALLWIDPDLAGPLAYFPRDRLRRANFTGELHLGDALTELTVLEGHLDGEAVSGTFRHRFPSDRAPGEIGLEVTLGQLVLGDGSVATGTEADMSQLASLMTTHRVDLAISGTQVSIDGRRLGAGRVAMTADPNTVSGTFDARLEGPSNMLADASLGYRIEADGPVWFATARLDVPALSRTMTELGIEELVPVTIQRAGDFSFVLDAGGGASSGVFDINFDGARADAALSGNIVTGQGADEPFARISVESGRSNLDALPMKDITGQLSLETARLLRIDHLSATLGGRVPADASVSGAIEKHADGRYALTADMVGENVDLGRAIGRFGDLLTLSGSTWIGARVESEADSLVGLSKHYRGQGRLDGRAILRARKSSGGALRLGSVKRLRDWLAGNFGAGAPTLGTFRLSPGRIDLDSLKLDGRRAKAGGNATLDLATNHLTANIAAYEPGNGTPYLDIQITGPFSKPNVTLGGRWISGD